MHDVIPEMEGAGSSSSNEDVFLGIHLSSNFFVLNSRRQHTSSHHENSCSMRSRGPPWRKRVCFDASLWRRRCDVSVCQRRRINHSATETHHDHCPWCSTSTSF